MYMYIELIYPYTPGISLYLGHLKFRCKLILIPSCFLPSPSPPVHHETFNFPSTMTSNPLL